MKNFDDFVEFLRTDCMFEINQLGDAFDSTFTEDDIKATGLSPECLGKLLQMFGFMISNSVLLMLRRYHEWLNEFPDTSQSSDRR